MNSLYTSFYQKKTVTEQTVLRVVCVHVPTSRMQEFGFLDQDGHLVALSHAEKPFIAMDGVNHAFRLLDKVKLGGTYNALPATCIKYRYYDLYMVSQATVEVAERPIIDPIIEDMEDVIQSAKDILNKRKVFTGNIYDGEFIDVEPSHTANVPAVK